MSFDWSTLATLAILTGTLHWVIARAKITQWFWNANWLPGIMHELLECPACSGFWLGLGLGVAGLRPLVTGLWPLDLAAAGVAGIIGTPVAQGVLLWGLERTRIE